MAIKVNAFCGFEASSVEDFFINGPKLFKDRLECESIMHDFTVSCDCGFKGVITLEQAEEADDCYYIKYIYEPCPKCSDQIYMIPEGYVEDLNEGKLEQTKYFQ